MQCAVLLPVQFMVLALMTKPLMRYAGHRVPAK